jgi:hypothetical protein
MFGFIIRRESFYELVNALQELRINDEIISSGFLISLVLQYSDIELRTRLI